MKLYEIDAAIERLVESLADPETGEVNEDALDELNALQMERGAKLENIALAYKNLRSDAEELKVEEAALKERRERKERRAERLKQFLSRQLDGEKMETPRVAVSFRKSSAVDINNPTLALSFLANKGYTDCIRVKDPDIDKAACKRLIGVGVTIPGVEIISRQSISIK